MSNISLLSDERTAISPHEGEIVPTRTWWQAIKSHCRRVPLEVLSFLVGYDWFFRLVGFLNKHMHFIESVFLVYPASEKYALAYVYPHRLRKVVWSPWFCGVLWQNRKLSMMFCISANNGQYSDPKNFDQLRSVAGRMEQLRVLLNANGKTFAGILPGILYAKRIVHEAPEADLTAVAIGNAIALVKTNESLPLDTPIIVLGGRGFIGRRVVKLLQGLPVYSIDSAADQDHTNWPNHLLGERVIVVNSTLNNALEDYISVMWPGTVILNEVYPEPQAHVLEKLSQKKCACYHIVGIRAFALPSLPFAYEGAIPCCAAWSAENMQVMVRKLG